MLFFFNIYSLKIIILFLYFFFPFLLLFLFHLFKSHFNNTFNLKSKLNNQIKHLFYKENIINSSLTFY